MSTNPYITQICEQTGATEREVITDTLPSFRPMTFPCVIGSRTFWSQDDYLNQMYEYLAAL